MNGLAVAITMELDGENYYKRQAEATTNAHLKKLFTMLAKDEKKHAQILQKRFDKTSYELTEFDALAESKKIFSEAVDMTAKVWKTPEQLEIYRGALEKEKQSIALYEKFLSQSVTDDDKKLFTFLVEQEKDHYTIFDDLIQYLDRPMDRIETAEFGIRNEY